MSVDARQARMNLMCETAPSSSSITPLVNSRPTASSSIMPRLSLPAFAAPKLHRTLHHRQSHPAPASSVPDEEDVFEKRFIMLDTLGTGAFSTVFKVQKRYGDSTFAVKRARGVFDGEKDRSVARCKVNCGIEVDIPY